MAGAENWLTDASTNELVTRQFPTIEYLAHRTRRKPSASYPRGSSPTCVLPRVKIRGDEYPDPNGDELDVSTVASHPCALLLIAVDRQHVDPQIVLGIAGDADEDELGALVVEEARGPLGRPHGTALRIALEQDDIAPRVGDGDVVGDVRICLLYTSPSPRDS